MKVRVGELESAPIREVWPDEARDLTPWLADNLDALGSALGMDLELDGSEAPSDRSARICSCTTRTPGTVS